MKRAKADLRRGTSQATAAGEFVREEIEHIRRGKHGARSTKQAIAIGLSRSRRAGIDPGTPKIASARVKPPAGVGRHPPKISKTRSRASLEALKREPHDAASKKSLSRHAHAVANRRKHPTARSKSTR
jgi:hypothetical protein